MLGWPTILTSDEEEDNDAGAISRGGISGASSTFNKARSTSFLPQLDSTTVAGSFL